MYGRLDDFIRELSHIQLVSLDRELKSLISPFQAEVLQLSMHNIHVMWQRCGGRRGKSVWLLFKESREMVQRKYMSNISDNQKKKRDLIESPKGTTNDHNTKHSLPSGPSACKAGLVHTPLVSCTRLWSRAHASELVHTPRVSCTCLRWKHHAAQPLGYEENSMRWDHHEQTCAAALRGSRAKYVIKVT